MNEIQDDSEMDYSNYIEGMCFFNDSVCEPKEDIFKECPCCKSDWHYCDCDWMFCDKACLKHCTCDECVE